MIMMPLMPLLLPLSTFLLVCFLATVGSAGGTQVEVLGVRHKRRHRPADYVRGLQLRQTDARRGLCVRALPFGCCCHVPLRSVVRRVPLLFVSFVVFSFVAFSSVTVGFFPLSPQSQLVNPIACLPTHTIVLRTIHPLQLPKVGLPRVFAHQRRRGRHVHRVLRQSADVELSGLLRRESQLQRQLRPVRRRAWRAWRARAASGAVDLCRVYDCERRRRGVHRV